MPTSTSSTPAGPSTPSRRFRREAGLPDSEGATQPGSISLYGVLAMVPTASTARTEPHISASEIGPVIPTKRASGLETDQRPPDPSVGRSSAIDGLEDARSSVEPARRLGSTKLEGHANNDNARERVRRYTKIGNPLTTWFFGGRLMTGGDDWLSCVFTVVILLGISGVWLGTTGAWLWVHGREYGLPPGAGVGIVVAFVYLFGLTTSSMIAASVRDPGIIPRNLDVKPPLAHSDAAEWEPLERELVIRRGRVTVRYCETCRSYRPPRSSHCRLCGNCVDGIDHHCAYLHTCVGKRNYFAFLTLLVSAAISVIFVVVFSAVHFSMLCHVDSISFVEALRASPGAAVSFLLGVLALPGVLFLLGYHCRLVFWNMTTVEQIRASETKNLLKATKRPDNPFAEDSIWSNILLASFARPQFPSWIQADRWDYKDTRDPNPALTDPALRARLS